jgi:hypothetical protein
VQERRADKYSKWKDGGGAHPADKLAELEDVEHLQVAAGLVALQVGHVLPEAATDGQTTASAPHLPITQEVAERETSRQKERQETVGQGFVTKNARVRTQIRLGELRLKQRECDERYSIPTSCYDLSADPLASDICTLTH